MRKERRQGKTERERRVTDGRSRRRETLNTRENLGVRGKKRTEEDTKAGHSGPQGSRTRLTTHPLCYG